MNYVYDSDLKLVKVSKNTAIDKVNEIFKTDNVSDLNNFINNGNYRKVHPTNLIESIIIGFENNSINCINHISELEPFWLQLIEFALNKISLMNLKSIRTQFEIQFFEDLNKNTKITSVSKDKLNYIIEIFNNYS